MADNSPSTGASSCSIRSKHEDLTRFIESAVAHKDGDHCLIWPFGRMASGYGQMTWRGVKSYPHRVVCELAHGAPPDRNYQAAHDCGNGKHGCVNPHHLRWATAKENMADNIRHGKTVRGHRAPTVKLTESDVLQIKKDLPTVSGIELAQRYGVSRSAIHLIKKGRNWAWV